MTSQRVEFLILVEPSAANLLQTVLRTHRRHPGRRHAHGRGHPARAAAAHLRAARWPGFRPAVAPGEDHAKNRAGWAHDRLKRAGLSQSPRRGYWKVTDEGLRFVKTAPPKLSNEIIAKIADASLDTPLKTVGLTPEERFAATGIAGDSAPTPDLIGTVSASPDDRLEQALRELRGSVTTELLETLGAVSPGQFEGIVLDLLHAMGYGASRSDLQRVGGSGDGGIDGIISLDRLGLEKVYVQAKRWSGSVGRPEVQGFYGALAGQRANKGVFITTSTFTSQAVEFARSVERVVLVDGQRLAELMIDHEVGVTSRTVRIPKLDGDYFEL